MLKRGILLPPSDDDDEPFPLLPCGMMSLGLNNAMSSRDYRG
jgi:hypothetical protein